MNQEVTERRHRRAWRREKKVVKGAKKANKAIVEKTDFSATELLKAPVEPPTTTQTDPPTRRQVGLMSIGLGVAVLGLLIALFAFELGVLVALIGGVIIAVGVMIRL